MTNPRQHKWIPIQKPATVLVNWSFNRADYSKLVAGIEAQSMDSKWDINFDDGVVHFYRSWTGFQIYNFALKQDGDKYVTESFNVEQDSGKYRRGDDEHEIENLSLLLEHVVGAKPQ